MPKAVGAGVYTEQAVADTFSRATDFTQHKAGSQAPALG